jgi:hypothetical protein
LSFLPGETPPDLFHDVLSQYAANFLNAKRDPRWPKSDRPTSQGRRIRSLARSMAGISMGISIRTTQDLLAKKGKTKTGSDLSSGLHLRPP